MENKYKTILLDLDGTVVDFKACERAAFKKALKKHSISYSDEIYNLYSNINMNLWLQYEQEIIQREVIFTSRFVTLFQELDMEYDGVLFEKDYQSLLANEHQLIDDAIEVIQYLHSKYELYVVTNGVASTQMKRLKASGLDIYMKDVFISETLGYQKPMKEFFDFCFDRIKDVKLSKTIIIGDSLTSDMQGGNNAGIATCWYNPDNNENSNKVPIDYTITSLRDLYQLF